MKITLKFEGGYFAEEKTKYSIMQGTYNTYRDRKHLIRRDIRDITKDEVYDCYYLLYWLRSGCDTLPYLTSLIYFDTAVNFGITGATNLFKGIPDTLCDKEKALFLCDNRIKRRYDIVERKPSKKKFLKGWLRRDNKMKKIIETYSN